jgi:uncharacterized RDD family membrane protein YckC
LIDFIIISVAFQLLVAFLFVATSGYVQMTSGVTYRTCSKPETLSDGLMPPPPADSNFALDCNVYFFGAQTARTLQVGRVTKEGMITKVGFLTYMLDQDGRPIKGVWADWIMILALIAYLVAMETRTGTTLGDCWTRIRVVDALTPDARGVTLSKIMIRYLMMLVGLYPMLAVALVYVAQYGFIEAAVETHVFTWLGLTGILALGWFAFICIQIVRKRDPPHDSVAGTVVVRVPTMN